jgi:hypothetical protein
MKKDKSKIKQYALIGSGILTVSALLYFFLLDSPKEVVVNKNAKKHTEKTTNKKVESVVNKKEVVVEKKKIAITPEEIDRIFMSFKQEEKERKKKMLEEETEKKKKIVKRSSVSRKIVRTQPSSSASSVRNILNYNEGRDVSEDENRSVKIGFNMNLPSLRNLENDKELVKVKLTGIICGEEGCVAYSDDGILLVGERISNSEKILKITKTFVLTSKRKIFL